MERTEPTDAQTDGGLGVPIGTIVEDFNDGSGGNEQDLVVDGSNPPSRPNDEDEEEAYMRSSSHTTDDEEEDEDDDFDDWYRLTPPPGLDEAIPKPADLGIRDPDASPLEAICYEHKILENRITEKTREILTLAYQYDKSYNKVYGETKTKCECYDCQMETHATELKIDKYQKERDEAILEKSELQKQVSPYYLWLSSSLSCVARELIFIAGEDSLG